MKTLLKKAREQKGLKTREVSQILGIDQALISKFESGTRKPTKEQITKLAQLLEIDYETLIIAWLKEKILYEIGDNEFALKALMAAEEEIKYNKAISKLKISTSLEKLLQEIDILKTKLDSYQQYDNSKIIQTLELEFIFESNRIEGNTMTLRETEMVINEGLTISGKSMREHLEAINHQEAISFIKDLIHKNNSLNERDLLSLHKLIFRSIMPENAGRYREVQIAATENSSISPQSFMITKEMADYFVWYEINKNKLHPIILAAEMHEKLIAIQPFIDGTEKTSRLLMNLILLQKGYLIANIKGDYETKIQYHQSLEMVQTKNSKEDFILFIAQIEKESLEHYFDLFSKKGASIS